MKKILLFAFTAVLLAACSSSPKSLRINLQDYQGLSDGERFRMTIDNPRLEQEPDTIYWSDDKDFEYTFDGNPEEFLAFVEVVTVDEEGYSEKYLFSSVVAIDGEAVISARSDSSLTLSGTRSNDLITAFWHHPLNNEDVFEEDMDARARAFMQEEMRQHPKDLYGAYLYSWDVFTRMCEAFDGEDTLPAVQALEEEIQSSNAYYAEHNVAEPFVGAVLNMGDISIFLIFHFVSYMYPVL